MPAPTRRIALVYDASSAYHLKVMAGVAAYLQKSRHQASYSVCVIEQATLTDDPLAHTLAGPSDGIIASVADPAAARCVAHWEVPTVSFGCGSRGAIPAAAIPYLHPNSRAIARLAADHLLDRGFRSLAYCGYTPANGTGWSHEREDAFVEYVKQRGGSCAVFRGCRRPAHGWTPFDDELAEWIERLPKPVGIMAAHDDLGRQVLEACGDRELRVPQDVAVIGVDNNELQCLLSTPALSSVEQGARRLGYGAAMLLDELIRGTRPRQTRFTVDPVGIVTRHSTDVVAIVDAKVAHAINRFPVGSAHDDLVRPRFRGHAGAASATIRLRVPAGRAR